MDDHVKAASDCYLTCMKTINHCLEMGGEHASRKHINIMLDCAKICQLMSDFACRESENHTMLSKLCADICKQCASECERLANGDNQMQECADMCRECADVCEK